MAFNYINIVGDCFPNTQAYVPAGKDPFVYTDLVWVTTQVAQATLEASSCANNNTTTYDVLSEGPIFTLVFNKEATAKNSWLSHEGDNSLLSNTVPAIIPWDCKMVALTFSNATSDVDADIEIYKALANNGSVNSLTYTWEVRATRTARISTFSPDIKFNAGDKIGMYINDKGSTAAYVSTIMYLQIINNSTADFIESFTGDF